MQQATLDLVDGSWLLVSDAFEARPDQERAGDVVALDAGFAALALLDTRQLLIDFQVSKFINK